MKGDFYEEDEPTEKIVAHFQQGPFGLAARTLHCECGRVTATGENFFNLRCGQCPPLVTDCWWFRLDEWCHRHLPILPFWPWHLHAPLCWYVEKRLELRVAAPKEQNS